MVDGITHRYLLVGGFNPSEKYEFVSWDDDIPNIWKVIKFMFQTTNQLITWLWSNIHHPLRGTALWVWPC